MVKPIDTAVVWPAEEDMIQVKKLYNGYLYSLLSKDMVEFSNHVDHFEVIENSINHMYPISGNELVDSLKKQLNI